MQRLSLLWVAAAEDAPGCRLSCGMGVLPALAGGLCRGTCPAPPVAVPIGAGKPMLVGSRSWSVGGVGPEKQERKWLLSGPRARRAVGGWLSSWCWLTDGPCPRVPPPCGSTPPKSSPGGSQDAVPGSPCSSSSSSPQLFACGRIRLRGVPGWVCTPSACSPPRNHQRCLWKALQHVPSLLNPCAVGCTEGFSVLFPASFANSLFTSDATKGV